MNQAAILSLAAVLGGALNSVVGGGTFIAFPALVFVGVPPVSANATTSFALWPGGVASAFAYRKDIDQPRSVLLALSAASLVGASIGALLLLRTSNTTFTLLVPWLLLFATILFTFGGQLTARVRAGSAGHQPRTFLLVATLVQLVIAIYGGYFGGGMGILMLAAWSILGMTNIHAMNGLRNLLSTLLNAAAVIAFIAAGAIAWRPGAVMILGATAGGYLGAALARRIDPHWVRGFVILVAWLMTAWFLVQAYWPRRG